MTAPDVWTVPEPCRQPKWTRERVYLNGRHIGYLDSRTGPEGTDWFVCDPRWNSVDGASYVDSLKSWYPGITDRSEALRVLVEGTAAAGETNVLEEQRGDGDA